MEYLLFMPVFLAWGLVGAAIGYVVGLLTERGRPNEPRRRVFALAIATLFILGGIPSVGLVCGWAYQQLH